MIEIPIGTTLKFKRLGGTPIAREEGVIGKKSRRLEGRCVACASDSADREKESR